MSYWTYISGTITVRPLGRTQAEKRYILDTVLDHLPRVTGSEGDMNIYVIQKKGHNCSESCDEFGETTNNLISRYGCKSRDRGWMYTQEDYIIAVDGSLRDREFEQAFREFIKWIVRLGKRVHINTVLVEIRGYGKSTIIRNNNIKNKKYSYRKVFSELFESPSWSNEIGEVSWSEYLMWDRAKDSRYPMLLAYKYFDDEENDKEVERRLNYNK